MSNITFPYASFDAGTQDKWSKIGGPVEAYRLMVNAFKQNYWRKGSNERRQDKVKRAMELLKQHEAKVGKREDRGNTLPNATK